MSYSNISLSTVKRVESKPLQQTRAVSQPISKPIQQTREIRKPISKPLQNRQPVEAKIVPKKIVSAANSGDDEWESF